MQINTQTKKETPHDIDVEESLIGAILFNSENFEDVAEIALPEHFYSPKNKLIFETMLTISNKGDAIDGVTVAAKLEDINKLDLVGKEYLAELLENSPTTAHIEDYAKIIKDKYILRNLQEVGFRISDLSVSSNKSIEEIVDESEKQLFQLTQKHTNVKYTSVADSIFGVIEEIVQVSGGKETHRGIGTGFDSLDNKLSGLHKSDLIIIAARPSVGKTSLALDIARRSASKHKTSVGIFSLEMSVSQLSERMLASESRLDAWKMRTGKLKAQNEFQLLNEAGERLRVLPIFIDERSSISVNNLRSTARRMKRENNIDMLIVDYLQLIQPHNSRKSNNLVEHITEVSRTLKQIARELQIPVVALSQLSRDIEKGGKRKPRLSDLRDSGSIEQDADVVIFLNRNEEYEGDLNSPIRTELLIEKHRNGPTGKVVLYFNRNCSSFDEESKINTDEYHLD